MSEAIPQGWDEKNRPPASSRWTNDRSEPVRFELRTRFLYSGDTTCSGGTMPALVEGRARHAFGRGGEVTRSDVPTSYKHMNHAAAHLGRAIAAFGDDADLVIEVRRAAPPEAIDGSQGWGVQPTDQEHNGWAWNCTLPTDSRPNGDARDAYVTCRVCPPDDPQPTSQELDR